MKIKLILSISILSSFSLVSAMSETSVVAKAMPDTPDQMLYKAIKIGDLGLKLAEKAIKLGANVNPINYRRQNLSISLLIFVIERVQAGHKIKKTVQLLLESGANIDTKNIHYSQELSALDIAKKFLNEPQYNIDLEELKDVINLIETEVISKEKAETLKKEINEHLIPDISDMVIQYAFLVKKEFKKDTNKEVVSVSI